MGGDVVARGVRGLSGGGCPGSVIDAEFAWRDCKAAIAAAADHSLSTLENSRALFDLPNGNFIPHSGNRQIRMQSYACI